MRKRDVPVATRAVERFLRQIYKDEVSQVPETCRFRTIGRPHNGEAVVFRLPVGDKLIRCEVVRRHGPKLTVEFELECEYDFTQAYRNQHG